jgi:hypothetical protein
LVHVEIDSIELAETNKIGADKDTEFAPLHLTLLAVP